MMYYLKIEVSFFCFENNWLIDLIDNNDYNDGSGIHIYGGDYFETPRSQWNPETLDEEPSDGAVIRGIFERENQRLNLG